ncbi:28S ribosomal protein S15, mitochondrial [Willisornis vidua]|uniref:Small ribosomal subunit protein uS15m n=1 Tax=Willisornis vidua TaxID=1566151 RepID=A0ABQ9D946_9PASS|nr:28S ribosomal protein S15, mitochondrial [Willisornis vidua]
MLALLGRGLAGPVRAGAAAVGRAQPDIPSQLDDLPPTMLKKDYANLPIMNSVDDVVKRLLSLEMASQKEKMKVKIQQLVEKCLLWCCGSLRSSSAQLAASGEADDPGIPGKAAALTQLLNPFFTVAVLTAKIRMLEEHLERHPKDKNNRRQMLMAVDRRKKLLSYLRRVRYDTFENTCKQLGIQYSLPPAYTRRVTKRWLVKKAFCMKVYQEVQKLKAPEKLKQRREWQARARAAREQKEKEEQEKQKQEQEKQGQEQQGHEKPAQEGTPV